jgi:hypothetical protein
MSYSAAPSVLPECFLMPDGYNYQVVSLCGSPVLARWDYNGMIFWKGKGKFSKKDKKAFNRLNSGFNLAVAKDERLTFLTLTTQYDLLLDVNGLPVKGLDGRHVAKYPLERQRKIAGLNYAVAKLKQCIEYKIQEIMYCRLCKWLGIKPYYYNKRRKRCRSAVNYFKECRYHLRYFKLKTNEGGGVIHMIYRKHRSIPPISYFWLKRRWFEIWGAKNGVNIQDVPITDADQLSKYMVGQYFQKQPVLRMSYGHYWIGLKVKQRFLGLVEKFGYSKGLCNWKIQYKTNRLNTGCIGRTSRLRWRLLPKTVSGVIGEKIKSYVWCEFDVSRLGCGLDGGLILQKGLTRLFLDSGRDFVKWIKVKASDSLTICQSMPYKKMCITDFCVTVK